MIMVVMHELRNFTPNLVGGGGYSGLKTAIFDFGVKNFLPSSRRAANGCFELTLHLLTLQKTNIIDIDRGWGSGESFEIRYREDPNSPDK